MRKSSLDVSYRFVDESIKTESKLIVVNFENPAARNAYIEKRSEAIANAVLNLRSNKDFQDIQKLISDENYAEAAVRLQDFFKNTKDATLARLGDEFATVMEKGSKLDQQSFMDILLAKTSGSQRSRDLANEILSGKDGVGKAVENYYKEKNGQLAESFGQLFGITKDQVLSSLLPALTANLSKTSQTTLGASA